MPFSFLDKLGIRDASKIFHTDNRFLGVDVGSSSIKIVQLRKEKERPILETYGELSLAKYVNAELGKPVRVVDTALIEALKDLVRESQAKARKAAISIPLKDSFLTTMELPELSESELKEVVPYEARKYVPIPMSEVVTDWWTLPPTSKEAASSSLGTEKKKFVTILLAAVPKDIIDKYKNILTGSGFGAVGVEIEAFSFARASLRHDFGPTMLLDMGASSTKMFIADAGVVRASHGVDHGSVELTLALSQSLGVEFARAEVLKRESGILRRPETEGVASVIEPLVDYVASEGERFLLGWSRKGGKAVSKIMIGGGGALLGGVGDLFVKKFGMEVAVVNPFSKVIYPAFLGPALKEVGPLFTNAVGLALRGF